jgi:hypothetical protein
MNGAGIEPYFALGTLVATSDVQADCIALAGALRHPHNNEFGVSSWTVIELERPGEEDQ